MCMRRAVLVVGWAPAIVRRNGPLCVSEASISAFLLAASEIVFLRRGHGREYVATPPMDKASRLTSTMTRIAHQARISWGFFCFKP